MLELAKIENLLDTKYIGKAPDCKNELWETIGSTNDRALELAKAGAASGQMIIAGQQTKGRGRHGNRWISPADSGMYVSFILRPPPHVAASEEITLYTLAAGVACVEAVIETTGVALGLKWVNDLVCDRKKVGGILAEKPGALVIGIGINVRRDDLSMPEELKDKVNWLDVLAGRQIDVNVLLAACANRLEDACDAIEQGNSAIILKKWRAYSVTLGKTVRATLGNTTTVGEAVDITDTGALIVQTSDGQQVVLHAGEISIRQADGSYA